MKIIWIIVTMLVLVLNGIQAYDENDSSQAVHSKLNNKYQNSLKNYLLRSLIAKRLYSELNNQNRANNLMAILKVLFALIFEINSDY